MKNVFYKIILLFQVILALASFVLDYLTDKKAGILHHIYYRKYQFENSIFSVSNIKIQKMILIFVILVSILLLVYAFYKSKNETLKFQTTLFTVFSLFLYFIYSSKFFIEKISYHYFIIAFSVIVFVQIFVVIFTLIKTLKNHFD